MPALIGRLVLVAIAIGLAVAAWIGATASVLARSAPDKALALSPGYPDALVMSADRRLLENMDIPPAELAASARRALAAGPLSAGAVRQLGLAADLEGKRPRARTLMQLSNRISQRDFLTHVWMIEERVAAEDIPGALSHYDLALTVSPRAQDLLFPVLSGAMDNADIRAAFGPYLRKSRPWMADFLYYALTTNRQPEYFATLAMAHGGFPKGPRFDDLRTRLVSQLVVFKQYPVAYAFVRSQIDTQGKALGETGFTAETLNPALGPLAWQLTDQPDIRTRQDEAGGVEVFASANATGVAAARVLFLAPGSYRFAQNVAPAPQADALKSVWTMQCLPGTAEDIIWRHASAAPQADVQERATVEIPGNCRAQQLTLTIAGGDTQADSGVRIGQLSFTRAPADHP